MEKIAIISGGASGLGYELAKQLIQKNLKVAILGRDIVKLEKASDSLNSMKSNSCIFFQCNSSVEQDVKKFFAALKGKYEITHLFNNAGTGKFSKPEETTQIMIDEVLDGNLKGTILLTTYLLNNTESDKGALIANIMSTAALLGRPGETVYCAAKWGARGYTEALKAYTKGSKYKVIAIYPGGMNTPFWNESGMQPDVSKFMKPEEVASKILDACLNIDSSFVTDITINRAG